MGSMFAGWYYDAVNVSLATAFVNNITSDPAHNPYPVLATPPILPQSIWKQVSTSLCRCCLVLAHIFQDIDMCGLLESFLANM